MSEQSLSQTVPSPSDEIDLIELLFSIWKRKWWVILFTIIFAGGAVAYTLLAKEEWISKAEIIQPVAADMGQYLERYEQYQSIIDIRQSKKKNKKENEDKRKLTQEEPQDALEKASEMLYSSFLSAVGAYENQLGYFKQSMPEATSNKLSGLLQSVSVEKPDKKKNIKFVTVELAAKDAITAQTQLNGLISYINKVVKHKVLNSLNTEIQTKIRTLTVSKESVKAFANTAQAVRLKNLNKALLIAKKAKIKRYSSVGNEQFILPGSVSGEAGIKLEDDKLAENNFLFMLGEDYLQAQIDALNDSETIYPEQYYQVELQIQLLTKLLNEQGDSQFDTFSYQSSPSLPLQRSKPKRTLIVLIGTFLGGIIGILVALFMGAVAARKERLAQINPK